METLKPTLTFAEAAATARRGSVSKRSRSAYEAPEAIPPPLGKNTDPGTYTSRAFDHWQLVTDVLDKANAEFQKDHPQLAIFEGIRSVLNSAASLQFDMAKRLDDLGEKGVAQRDVIDRHAEVLERNCAGGNIVNTVEKSSAYDKSCTELKESGNLCKVFELDFGSNFNSTTEIVKKAKEILENTVGLKSELKDAQIFPLGKKTTEKNDKHSVPILIKLKNKDNRDRVEKLVKGAGYQTAFHWPKNIMQHITCMRNQLKTFKNDKLDLSDKQIMIRPSFTTGRKLNIHYRKKDEKKWTLLESVLTPADDALVRQFKGEQVCKSEFFVL